MKTFQDFSPYNGLGLQWGPNGSRSKRWLDNNLNFISFLFQP